MSQWPRTGCSVVVHSAKRVLLVKRGKAPFPGHWSLPGGSQEAGETLEECARRELFEETGLRAETLEFATLRDRIGHDQAGSLTHHFVLATFVAGTVGGDARAGDDADDIGWFTFEEMETLKTTPDTVAFVRDLIEDRLNRA